MYNRSTLLFNGVAAPHDSIRARRTKRVGCVQVGSQIIVQTRGTRWLLYRPHSMRNHRTSRVHVLEWNVERPRWPAVEVRTEWSSACDSRRKRASRGSMMCISPHRSCAVAFVENVLLNVLGKESSGCNKNFDMHNNTRAFQRHLAPRVLCSIG